MAFPFTGHEDFEAGTVAGSAFNSETDTDAKLDIVHYRDLARVPGLPAPWYGAYCMRVDLAGGTNDAYLQENDTWDIAADGTLYFRFRFFVSADIVMADTDLFSIWQLESSGPVVEACVFLQYTTANGLRLGINETASASGASFLGISTGAWHTVEVFVNLDDGGSNDGTLDLWLDGGQATQITGLDQAAVVQGKLGAIGIDAGTTRGTLLFDDVTADDARIYGTDDVRFPESKTLYKTGHAFVGPGVIDNVTLLAGAGTDCVLVAYDTDRANVNQEPLFPALQNTANNEVVDPAGMPIRVQRGCYITLAGTNPRAAVRIGQVSAWGSDGAIRSMARKTL